jgi:peptidoglycan-N-acetylglucosamine deacetylase
MLQSGARRHGAVAAAIGAAMAYALSASTAAAAAPLQVSMMRGGQACVALTFDDGPDVDLTPKLLSVLESKDAVATFFVVGYRAKAWPAPVIRASNDGDEIGNHSWDHPALPSLSSSAALKELTRTDDIITMLTGHPSAVSRAPYGSMSPRVEALSPRTYIAWSVDTLDWRYPDVARITNTALTKATNGAIILMHDTHPKTIEAVPGIIDGLRQRGFRLVTVSDLLSGDCGGTPLGFGVAAPRVTTAAAPVTAAPLAKTLPSAKPKAAPQVEAQPVAQRPKTFLGKPI